MSERAHVKTQNGDWEWVDYCKTKTLLSSVELSSRPTQMPHDDPEMFRVVVFFSHEE